MKKLVLFSLVFLFAIFHWSFNPGIKPAEAQTSLSLVSPADSIKMTTVKPTFKWKATAAQREKIKKYHIVVARDLDLNDRVWEDSNIVPPQDTIVYSGTAFEQWKTYYWSVKVQVDSTRMSGIDTTFWYRFVKPRIFFYTTAKVIVIPDNLPTIQQGIVWAATGDTVLVKPGTYYENLRFNKKGVILASQFVYNKDTTTIKSTILDGSKLTRGKDYGSVVYFTSKADSTSKIMGFTIRNGTGTKFELGPVKKVNGGGIFCEPKSTPTISYNFIIQNQVPNEGGGIFCYSAAPNIFNNVIAKNSAGGSGGAIQSYYSIKINPPATPGPSGGGEEIELMPETGSAGTTTESNSKIEDDDWESSLYPKDATEVLSALSENQFPKLASTPPVAMLEYYIRRDTVVQREEIIEGDTIVLLGTGSYDPDPGDLITTYRWKGLRWQKCEVPNDWSNYTITPFTNLDSVEIPVISGMGGLYKISLIVQDTHMDADSSDTIYLNLQRPPRAYAGVDLAISPGDTVRMDGSGSCDINPGDAPVLTYLWTQISGPISVALQDSDKVRAYFVAYDDSYIGEYRFQLKVTEPDTFSLDTVKVTCSRAPKAVSVYDSLAGFTDADLLPLDASLSSDPDSGTGDYVKYFIWRGIKHITCKDSSALKIDIDSTKKVQSIPASRGGGIYKIELYVRDKFGTRSKNTDTLLISVQLPPEANAGPDTIIRPSTYAYLHGSACERNWDQASSLKYRWFKDPRNPFRVNLEPDSLVPQVKFLTSTSGVYRFSLRVTDSYGTSSWPDDTVKVVINELPKIVDITPDVSKVSFPEGDTVRLIVWARDSDDTLFGKILKYSWTSLNWPDFPNTTYKPTLINPTKDTVKFVPVKHGQYELKVVVHDTISPKQDPSEDPKFNTRQLIVLLDTTFAYPFIKGNLIWSNTAGSKGGGIDCLGSSPQIINNIFYKNKSGSSGGAICARFSSTPYIHRNIFFSNISRDSTGGAIANLKAELAPAASIGFREKMEVSTNDFWNNAGGSIYQPPVDVPGNLYVYPRLIDPEYGDFRLECSSPCKKDSIGLLLWLYPDTCGHVPDPSMISISLFQHPVATAVAHFLVNTDVPLKSPPLGYISIGENSPALVEFTSISSTTYRGSFVFTDSGAGTIYVFASSIQEVPDTLTKDFYVQLIGAGRIGKLVSHDNRLEVSFPQGAVKDEIFATCISVSENPQYNFQDEEKVALGEVYQLGPLSDFEKELTVRFSLDGYDLTDKDKTLFSIYKHEENGWKKQTSFLDENSICAKVKNLGMYRLVYDKDQEHLAEVPRSYQLFQNYPNPFNPQTMIKYDLPEAGQVNVTVYNILGQKVKTLVDEYQETGHKSAIWDGKDQGGKEVGSGIYFYKIKTKGFEKTRKMVLLK